MTSARRVTFHVHGLPQTKGSTKAFVPRSWAQRAARMGTTPRAIVTNDNTKARGWQQLVANQAQDVATFSGGMFLGPVAVALVFRLPRPQSAPKRVTHHVTKPDIDKLARCAIDGLTGVLLPDDRVVVELHARKVFARLPAPPGVEITVCEAAPPDPEQPAFALFQEA